MAKDVGFREDTGDEEGRAAAPSVVTRCSCPPAPARSPKGLPYGWMWTHPAGVVHHENGTIYRDTPEYRRLLADQKA